MRKFITLASAAAMLAPVFVATATPAEARHRAREWQGADGRTYCRKSDGTTGLVIGAAAGGLLGRAVDSSGSRVRDYCRFGCGWPVRTTYRKEPQLPLGAAKFRGVDCL